MSKSGMCQVPESDDIAETEFCLSPEEHPTAGNERMAEEGESEVNKEWIKMKKYVEDGEEEKVEQWLDRGIQEVKTEHEGINGSQGKLVHLLYTGSVLRMSHQTWNYSRFGATHRIKWPETESSSYSRATFCILTR